MLIVTPINSVAITFAARGITESLAHQGAIFLTPLQMLIMVSEVSSLFFPDYTEL